MIESNRTSSLPTRVRTYGALRTLHRDCRRWALCFSIVIIIAQTAFAAESVLLGDLSNGTGTNHSLDGVPGECVGLNCSPPPNEANIRSVPASLGVVNINAGGGMSSSANYALVASTAQAGGVGVSTSADYDLRDGFWYAASSVRALCPPVSNCDDADICTFDDCVAGVCSNAANAYGDVDFNNTVNLFDLFCVLDGFGGIFTGNCTFDRLDIEPCGGNSSLNLFDLFAVLDSFSGVDPCCAPLP